MSSSSNKKRIWRRIGVALAAIILIPGLLLAGYIMYLSAGAGANAIHPPQIPITQLPAAFGIADVQTLSLTTQDQVQLKAWYIPPQPETGMVILLLHGYAHNRQDVLPEAKILTSHGFGALLLDLRGHGESQPAAVTFGEKEQLDVRAALDWLSARPEVKRIGGMGFSMGGATMAIASARDSRISRSVVAVA